MKFLTFEEVRALASSRFPYTDTEHVSRYAYDNAYRNIVDPEKHLDAVESSYYDFIHGFEFALNYIHTLFK